jgi:hypothetical protein
MRYFICITKSKYPFKLMADRFISKIVNIVLLVIILMKE